jgi:exonuclease III
MAIRQWKVLSWNIRGINSDKKWNSIRDRITESNCDVICLQETKRSHFDSAFIRQFCPLTFDCFEYLPSNGASGGSITIWKSSMFSGNLIFQNDYATSVLLTSTHNSASWIISNIYAPCTPSGKRAFTQWFKNISMPTDVDWLIVGDFNLYRNPEDRNRTGADFTEMLLFNGAISALGLVELPLRGQRFTWTNKQHPPFWNDLIGFSPL